MDLWHKITNYIDHNRGLFVALILAGIVSVAFVGCQPKTYSLVIPNEKVTLKELEREILVEQSRLEAEAFALESKARVFAESAEIAKQDIYNQIDSINKVIETVGGIALTVTGGSFSAPAAVGTVITAILGLGAGGLLYDNRRKDKLIK